MFFWKKVKRVVFLSFLYRFSMFIFCWGKVVGCRMRLLIEMLVLEVFGLVNEGFDREGFYLGDGFL